MESVQYEQLKPAIDKKKNKNKLRMMDHQQFFRKVDGILSIQRQSHSRHGVTDQVRAELKTADFDVWKYDQSKLLVFLEEMYYELGLVQEFKIKPATLRRFLISVQSNYRSNPFHNFQHCFCVTQMMYVFIHRLQLQKYLTRKEVGILITASICHDLDHPGFSNSFQINAGTELAVRYNGLSPLENHHCATCFQILKQEDCNIFQHCSKEEFSEIRKELASLILATDMNRHKEITDEFSERLKNFSFDCKDDVNILKQILIKACDVSNECRPIVTAEPWADCLLEEYFNQHDLEKSRGLPTSPFMDRSRTTKASSQIGFIQFVLIPLFEEIKKLFAEIENFALANLRKALAYYEKQQEEENNQ